MLPHHEVASGDAIVGVRGVAARRTLRDAPWVPALADTARFRADDPDSLVIASLACPICLGSEQVRWEASVGGYDPRVRCECPDCSEHWTVYLAPQQALRFALFDPPDAGCDMRN